MIIYVIGYMGSGKSTYGKQCADKMHFNFIDLDTYIEERTKKKINDIFNDCGEEFFRNLETECLKEISSENQDLVIACGGGTPLYNNNIDFMNSHGLTIYLKLQTKDIVKHLMKPHELEKRPLLKNLNTQELLYYVTQDIQEREKTYNKCQLTIMINYETFNYKRS